MTQQELIAFFEDLHSHPELGLQETRTTQKLKEMLDQAGIPYYPAGLETGMIAVIEGKQPGRVIGLRADMDALPIQEEADVPYRSGTPGVMHACGHDFHTSCMLGAALLIKERQAALRGTVKIVFQPAEEISRGGRVAAASPLLKDAAEFYACHTYPAFPSGVLGIKPGPVMAAPDAFTIRILGKGAHAGNPHQGVDPVPAMAALILSAQTLLTRRKDAFEPAVLSFCHIRAGSTWNIVPEKVEIQGTLRTLNEDLRRDTIARLDTLVSSIAQAHGCEGEIAWEKGPGPVVNDAALCEEAKKIALDMGFSVRQQANTMGGEDFSEYLKNRPGAFIRVGTGGEYANHHPLFRVDENALYPAARFFAELAIRRAAQP
ncbi:MAG: amidohydrolase [Clostridia bacterium]|nr:amidohydrolase [Clostridia bacterium]